MILGQLSCLYFSPYPDMSGADTTIQNRSARPKGERGRRRAASFIYHRVIGGGGDILNTVQPR